jgi:potassium-transporting ATPase ATP-binding subunit
MKTENPTESESFRPTWRVPPISPPPRKRLRHTRLFAPELVWIAFKQSFVMLRPDIQWANPVMFVVEVGAFLTLAFVIQVALGQSSSQVPTTYFIALDVWLFPHYLMRSVL